MSDTKLDPRSLSAEEEAILDACFRGNIHDLGSAIVCYGRALFGQGASEAKATREVNRLPEPAAPVVEMPEAVHRAWLMLDVAGQEDSYNGKASRHAAVALRDWWRTHAQPVANVGMTEELQKLLSLIEGGQPHEAWTTRESAEIDRLIAGVRAKAVAPRKLEKVRSFLNLMGLYYKKADTDLPQKAHTQGSAWAEALAELDAFEGKP